MSAADKIISELSFRFNKASRRIQDNSRGTLLHSLECDVAYLLNAIARGPAYIIPKHVDAINSIIESLNRSQREDAPK